MKVRVIGLERSEGVTRDKPGKPGGKDYAIGRVHAAVALDVSRNGEKNVSKGTMGTTYEGVPVECIRRLEHLPLPFDAELVIEPKMRFGKLENAVMDVRPIGIVKEAGPAPVSLAKAA